MIKVAVIGLGNMGQHHAKAYAKIKEAHFIAACDPNRDRFEAVQKEPDTQYFKDVDSMLGACSIDAVSICVPTFMHFDIAKKCMDQGIAVLVEKPIATSVEEANKLVAVAEDNNVLLTVGHIERFNPAILKAKELINEGKLGAIHTIQCKRYGPFPKQIKDAQLT